MIRKNANKAKHFNMIHCKEMCSVQTWEAEPQETRNSALLIQFERSSAIRAGLLKLVMAGWMEQLERASITSEPKCGCGTMEPYAEPLAKDKSMTLHSIDRCCERDATKSYQPYQACLAEDVEGRNATLLTRAGARARFSRNGTPELAADDPH